MQVIQNINVSVNLWFQPINYSVYAMIMWNSNYSEFEKIFLVYESFCLSEIGFGKLAVNHL